MENRPIGPEEQDDTTDSASTKKKRGSTLSRYLSALRGKEASTNDSEETGAEKPKRAQRLLSRLFPGIVERPAHLSREEPNNQEFEFNHEAWFGWARQAKQGEPVSHQPEQERATVLETHQADHDSSESTPDEESKVGELPTVNRVGPEADDKPMASPDVATPNPVGLDNRVNMAEQNPVQAAELLAVPREQGEIPLGSTTKTETIIQRRGSNLLPIVLVGAEYLGRKKADRKLETRVDSKIDASNEKQRRSEALQKELEQVVSQNKQQIEQLKEARMNIERQPPRVPVNKEVAPSIPAPEVRAVQQPEAPRIEHTPVKEEEVVKPQNIAERVADAAEHDVPVERAFERSHEVKDDIPMAATGAAASVGAVMAANVAAAGLNSVTPIANKAATPDDKNLPFLSDADITASYKQAAKMGFWTAVCLIILGVIAYLMVRYI